MIDQTNYSQDGVRMWQVLILEDNPTRCEVFLKALRGNVVVITEDVSECITRLQERHWDFLFMDHDLGGKVFVESGPDTGYAVARWLSLHEEHMPSTIYVHSLNPVGAKNIKAVLPKAQLHPFHKILGTISECENF